ARACSPDRPPRAPPPDDNAPECTRPPPRTNPKTRGHRHPRRASPHRAPSRTAFARSWRSTPGWHGPESAVTATSVPRSKAGKDNNLWRECEGNFGFRFSAEVQSFKTSSGTSTVAANSSLHPSLRHLASTFNGDVQLRDQKRLK